MTVRWRWRVRRCRRCCTSCATGSSKGKGVEHPDIRGLFTREALLASDWYADRLKAKQEVDIQLWRRHVKYLETFLAKPNYAEEAARLGVPDRLRRAWDNLNHVSKPEYAGSLVGTIGVQRIAPSHPPDAGKK
jgi:phosphoenolpyruvate carboxykinase (diphosphate)